MYQGVYMTPEKIEEMKPHSSQYEYQGLDVGGQV